MDASEIVLTAEGRQKLMEELAWREGDKSKEIIEHIKEARAFGDLSENSEYDAAKEEQAKNAARIAEIQAILANAQDAGTSLHGLTVSIGSIVALVDADGVATEVTLVGTTETNVLEHKISNESPCGSCDHRPCRGRDRRGCHPIRQDPYLHHHQDFPLNRGHQYVMAPGGYRSFGSFFALYRSAADVRESDRNPRCRHT